MSDEALRALPPRVPRRDKALAAAPALIGLLVLAAAVRLSTIGLQDFWFDEAFTPVHVLHPSIVATMETMAHTENTPPLWYVLIWIWTRLFGAGVVAMRLPSAFAGIGLVAVLWAIGEHLGGRRAAIVAAAIGAVNPLFVWYSQEARAYELFALTGALAILCFLRAERDPSGRRMTEFAVAGCLALLSHYFAVFLLVPMALWLLRRRERWRVTAPAVGAIALVGLALLPLLIHQGGHGTQWIGEWAFKSRLEAIPQYYLTGESGAPLGHGIELLVALPIIFGALYGLWRRLDESETSSALIVLGITVVGIGAPIVIDAGGARYLSPRNLIAAMVALTALIAVLATARRTGVAGLLLSALIAVGGLAICIDVDLSPRLQRGDWGAVARGLSRAPGVAVVTAHLGSAPIEYYAPRFRHVSAASTLTVREIDVVGYAPLLPAAGKPPAAGFRAAGVSNFNGLLVYRYISPRARSVPLKQLRGGAITAGETDVLAFDSRNV